MDGISIHSRVIDRLLRDGNLIMANKMLGRNYQIDGFQIKGQGLGSREFVPTINLKIKNYTLPRDGVYATFTRVGEERFKSITFLGHRSTTDGSFAVETHILDRAIKSEDNQRLFVEFVSDIRTNRKFESFGELKAQIDLDIKRAKEIMGEK
jgi:riboflavin kinase/FMN adenylyltransferase